MFIFVKESMQLRFLVFREMSACLYDRIEVCRCISLHWEFSGDEQKLLAAPLSRYDCCSRKSHLLDPISLEVTGSFILIVESSQVIVGPWSRVWFRAHSWYHDLISCCNNAQTRSRINMEIPLNGFIFEIFFRMNVVLHFLDVCALCTMWERREEVKRDWMEKLWTIFTWLQDRFHAEATSMICIRNILQGVATYIVIAWIHVQCTGDTCSTWSSYIDTCST